MKFSQRIGKTSIKTLLQVESIDNDLKNRIWNVLLEDFFDKIQDYSMNDQETEKGHLCKYLWTQFFVFPIDTISSYDSGKVFVPGFISFLRKWYFNEAEWYEIYDFLEIISIVDNFSYHLNVTLSINKVLEREVSGYRIVNKKVVQITSENEIAEIEEALNKGERFSSVNAHLSRALHLLADRNNPDYRNSIKESISAVEALCKIIIVDDNATLGKALNEIEKKVELHKALKTAFSSLYGFTSDAGGIRHSLLENNLRLKFEDAKFMLVSCSAFINFLKTKI